MPALILVACLALLHSASAQLYPRLEIKLIANSPEYAEQKDLLILSMIELQARPTSDPYSYFQLAAIHGLPSASWEAVMGSASASHTGGYCHHLDTLFLPWHRPYLYIFEQELIKIAANIAARYNATFRPRYRAAARQLRLPYWDWADRETSVSGIPSIFVDSKVVVREPTLGVTAVNNPLAYYTFPSDVDAVFGNGTKQKIWGGKVNRTMRHPDDFEYMNVTSLNGTILSLASKGGWTKQLYVIFMARDWPCFYLSGVRCINFNSLEALHGSVHVAIGGQSGDMTFTPISSFDPIFFFHHCNVDRQLAMWQLLNPNTPWPTAATTMGTFAVPSDSIVDSSSQLYPFLKPNSTRCYSSADVVDWQVFNYTYPEVMDLPSPASMWNRVTNLYGPLSPSYTWLVLLRLRIVTTKPSSFAVRVFLNYPGRPSPSTGLSDPHLCGSLNVFQSKLGYGSTVSGSVDCTYTARAQGLSTKKPSDPSKGPDAFPFNISDLDVVLVSMKDGSEYSSAVSVSTKLGWLYPNLHEPSLPFSNIKNQSQFVAQSRKRKAWQ